MKIANRHIGREHPPFVIAEMSGNHNQSLERALEIVDAAAEAGAHALKLQTYTADTITLDVSEGDFYIHDKTSLWAGTSLHRLYQQAYTPWEWHEPIFKRCQERGLICFSSPFDESAVDFLESLNVPAYKIASFELVHLPLICKAAATGKPLIMSTGMATIAEIDDAVQAARAAGCTDMTLLKCTSTYPATPENSNLRTIPSMREIFECEIGLSDHTMGVGAAIAAVALGASVIEKHFTLSRADGGVDSAFSMEPAELKLLIEETERAWLAMGQIAYGPREAELKSLGFRRSLYIAQDIKAGETLTPENLRCIRPGHGLPPKFYDFFIGRKMNQSAKKGTPLTWHMVG